MTTKSFIRKQILITPEVNQKLRKLAFKDNISTSELIRQILDGKRGSVGVYITPKKGIKFLKDKPKLVKKVKVT